MISEVHLLLRRVEEAGLFFEDPDRTNQARIQIKARCFSPCNQSIGKVQDFWGFACFLIRLRALSRDNPNLFSIPFRAAVAKIMLIYWQDMADAELAIDTPPIPWEQDQESISKALKVKFV